jgi:hypothetical protein
VYIWLPEAPRGEGGLAQFLAENIKDTKIGRQNSYSRVSREMYQRVSESPRRTQNKDQNSSHGVRYVKLYFYFLKKLYMHALSAVLILRH